MHRPAHHRLDPTQTTDMMVMSGRRDLHVWSADLEERLGQACCLPLVRSRGVGPTLARPAADTSRSTVTSLPDLVGSAYGDLRAGEWQLAGAA